MTVVTKRGSGVLGRRIGRARQGSLGLHDVVIRTTGGGAGAVCGSAIGSGSSICLVREEENRQVRRDIDHLRVVRQSLEGLQEGGVERSPEAEGRAGADHVVAKNIPFAGLRLRQPGLAYCNRHAGGRGHTGDSQRITDETGALYSVDRNNMHVDVV